MLLKICHSEVLPGKEKQYRWKTNCGLDIRHFTNIFTTLKLWIGYSLGCSTQVFYAFFWQLDIHLQTKQSTVDLRCEISRVNEKHMFYQHTIVGRGKSYENFHRNPVPSLQMHKYHGVSVDNGNILLLAVYLHIYTFKRLWHLSHEAIWSKIAHTCQLAKLVKSYFHPNHFFIFGFIQPGCVGFRFNRTWFWPIFCPVFQKSFVIFYSFGFHCIYRLFKSSVQAFYLWGCLGCLALLPFGKPFLHLAWGGRGALSKIKEKDLCWRNIIETILLWDNSFVL